MNNRDYTFSKAERLCKKKLIATLFEQNSLSLVTYPLRLLILHGEKAEESLIPILIIVSKKKVRRAVHRNTIKRRIRSAYRFEKYLLYDHQLENKIRALGLIYLADTPLTFKFIRQSLDNIFRKMVAEHKQS